MFVRLGVTARVPCRPDHPNALHNYAFLLHHTLQRPDEAELMYQVGRSAISLCVRARKRVCLRGAGGLDLLWRDLVSLCCCRAA